jgi:hypothetical protein
VFYLDFESGKLRLAKRLSQLNVDLDRVDEYFHVHFRDRTIDSPDKLRFILAQIAKHYPNNSVVVVDAWRTFVGAITQHSEHDENSAQAIAYAMEPLAEAEDLGLTVLLIDHPSKTTTSESTYVTSGSGAKEAIASVVYWVDKVDPYSVYRQGAISLSVIADRDGELPVEPQFYKIGGQEHGNALYFEKSSEDEVGVYAKIADEAVERLKGVRPEDAWTLSKLAGDIKGGTGQKKNDAIIALIGQRIAGGKKGNSYRLYDMAFAPNGPSPTI